jgi:quercetin dioxygenase-like cupin family protein
VIIHDLSPEAVARMPRVNVATVEEEPESPIGYFQFHGCTCGVASGLGQGPWEFHGAGDEALHILSGQMRLVVRLPTGEVVRTLAAGDFAIVPQGCWHRGDASEGFAMLFMTPTEGNRHSFDDPV